MAESADRTTVTKTTGMRASIRRSCVKTSRPDWSGRRRSRRITSGQAAGDSFQALCAGVGDLDPVSGCGEHVAHLVAEQVRVVIDQEQVGHGLLPHSR